MRLPEGMAVERVLSEYRKDPAVLYAEPDYVVQVDLVSNDPRFAELWGLHNTGQTGGTADADIDAPEAWNLSTGSSQVVVGVLDTGIDYNHEDLFANVFQNPLDCNTNQVDDDGNGFVDDCHGIDAFNHDSDPMDDNGHGTHVSGTIGAVGNNGVGVVGVNWTVRIIACKFLNDGGSGFVSGAIACLDYLATMKDLGVNLVATNNSYGGDPFSKAFFDAIDAHRQRGILFIASAGNNAASRDGFPDFPSSFYLPNVLSVAATDHNDELADFSNFGRHTVHLGAPGVDVLSTVPGALFGDSYLLASGTSMAAPHVTGVAALLAAQNPLRDWKALKNLLLAGGDTGGIATPGHLTARVTISQKRLNARGSMTCSNSVVLSRLRPTVSVLTTTPGQPVDLAVLHINCANPNGNVTVSVDGGVEMITLLDDGLGADQEAGDGIYSSQWVPAATGTHTFTFPNNIVVTIHVLSPYRFSPAAFSYRTVAGQNLNLSDDSGASITPGFPILFGGAAFDTLSVLSNGNISFTGGGGDFFNELIPTGMRSSLVAPFWDDLYPIPGTGHNVFWEVQGVAPNRELIIEWRDVEHFFFCFDPPPPVPSTIRFQVVFFEGRSDILFNYADTLFDPGCDFLNHGASATVGVQVSPQVGTQFSHDSPSLHDGLALLWELGHHTPSLSRLFPFSAIAGGPAFALKAYGANFVPSSVVLWNGVSSPTAFMTSTLLEATIASSDISTPTTALVSVTSPGPGGGASVELPFAVYATHPTPALAELLPSSVTATGGFGGLTLRVLGTDFVSGSVVRWNGADRPTTALDSTTLDAQISSSDIAEGALNQVTVFNPAPGGGPSNVLTLTVQNPAPQIGAILPAFAPAGGPAFTLNVETPCTGDPDFCIAERLFVPSSVVLWNGAERPTTYRDQTWLTATIPATDLANPGTAEITVLTPSPGGGTSNVMLMFITAPPAINEDGVVSGASFAPAAGVAPGSITAVFGTDLAATTEVATLLPLPTTLGGAQMHFNDSMPVPKFFASPLQVNIQVPWELAGQFQATLTDTVGPVTSPGEVVPLAPFSPGLFAANQQGSGQGAILIANTPNLAAPIGMFPGSRPALRGTDHLEIYWTGGGAVTNQPATGTAASANPLSETTATPSVTIGGVPATVMFSGLAPGFVGLYVVTLQVPADAPTGDAVPVVLTIGGVQSNTITLAIE